MEQLKILNLPMAFFNSMILPMNSKKLSVSDNPSDNKNTEHKYKLHILI